MGKAENWWPNFQRPPEPKNSFPKDGEPNFQGPSNPTFVQIQISSSLGKKILIKCLEQVTVLKTQYDAMFLPVSSSVYA